VPSLRQLVAAALPPVTQPSQLGKLAIFHGHLSLPAVLSCPFLGHLTSLTLSFCIFSDVGVRAGIAAVLQQAPRLHSLSLRGCQDEAPSPPRLSNARACGSCA